MPCRSPVGKVERWLGFGPRWRYGSVSQRPGSPDFVQKRRNYVHLRIHSDCACFAHLIVSILLAYCHLTVGESSEMSTQTVSPIVAAPGGSFLLETRTSAEVFTPEDLNEEQRQIAATAVQFARAEGIIPAPESAHAIRAAVDEALVAREEGRSKVILFCLSGHGHFDLGAYEAYLGGQLQN